MLGVPLPSRDRMIVDLVMSELYRDIDTYRAHDLCYVMVLDSGPQQRSSGLHPHVFPFVESQIE